MKSKDLIEMFEYWCEVIPTAYPGSKYRRYTPQDFVVEFEQSDSVPFLYFEDYHLLPHYVGIMTRAKKVRREKIKERVEKIT